MSHPATTKTKSTHRAAPSFALRPCDADSGVSLCLAGEWTSLTLGMVEKKIANDLGCGQVASINFADVTGLDTSGALLLHTVVCRSDGKRALMISEDEEYIKLMDMVAQLPAGETANNKKANPALLFLNDFGKVVVAQYKLGVQLVSFLGEYLVTVAQLLRSPGKFPFTSLVYHMQQVGVAAVPIVALLSFLIGLVIAYMGAQQLARFGAEIFVINLVEITTLRELGVLMTSIVIAGRSGSSFTAQIGAMKSNEEVDAMRTMGLSPMLRLAFPRITALVIMLPALVFLSDIMGLIGGGVAAWTSMDIAPGAYIARMRDAVSLGNFFVGMVKAPFFAVTIGIIGCYQGFQVTGSAESVGKLTTQAVVQSIFLVMVLDALFALFFTGIGV